MRLVRSITFFEQGHEGSELSINFEDGTTFSMHLGVKTTLEAKFTRGEGGQHVVLQGYPNSPVIFR